ncbi:MAG: hypothetical protein MJ149_01545 [Clostridia bacterium]|nr:hypothetical protein [Clostridia bacterium]
MKIYGTAKEAAFWWTNQIVKKEKDRFYTLLFKLISVQLDYDGKSTLETTSKLEGILKESALLCGMDITLPTSLQNVTMKIDTETVEVKGGDIADWQTIYNARDLNV